MQYAGLKEQISGNLPSNNANLITAEIVRNVLNAMVDSLGRGYQFMGFATPTTNPGTPDQRVFYIAQVDGTYINFGNLQVVGITFLFWETSWTAVTLNVSSGGGGGTGLTSIGLNMPSMFEVDPAAPLTQNGAFNVSLKQTYTIPTVTDWNDVFGKRHTHSNKSVLDGITAQDINHWDAAYQAIGQQSGILPFNAPIVRIIKGRKVDPNPTHPYASYIRVDHPLLALGGEVVLMVRNKRNKKKFGSGQGTPEQQNKHWPRKGWFVARGHYGNAKWVYKPSGTPRSVTVQLYGLQAYICQHFTQVGSNTRAQMEALSYINWCNAASTVSFGFDDGGIYHHRKSPKQRRMFGIAVRIVNPEWIEQAGGSPTEWTQDMWTGTTSIPRYLYSPVAPLIAEISSNQGDTYRQRLGLMPL